MRCNYIVMRHIAAARIAPLARFADYSPCFSRGPSRGPGRRRNRGEGESGRGRGEANFDSCLTDSAGEL